MDNGSGKIKHVGSRRDATARAAAHDSAAWHVVSRQTILAGFIDGHMHVLSTGQDLERFDGEFAAARLPATGQRGEARELDDLDARPIYVVAEDYHSTWCNSAELGVADMEDPPGGRIHPDDHDGRPLGLLSEAASLDIAMAFLSRCQLPQEQRAAVERAFGAYLAAGYTGLVEMATDQTTWAALQPSGTLSMAMACYWLVMAAHTLDEALASVDQAVVLDIQWDAERLLEAKATETWIKGRRVYAAASTIATTAPTTTATTTITTTAAAASTAAASTAAASTAAASTASSTAAASAAALSLWVASKSF
ncbi:hypothetical protein CDD81_42 [Ophiocordyceps australis]|uniref:Amidohydrolase 3 domain-containing protein n=1 Tax=Ophiocordyceps australis TaxID=1399860 RepID=A0A2C5YKH8_9HYPO|nr:hypothetical protein CDD81_42 [Ophiocordyceps australis]